MTYNSKRNDKITIFMLLYAPTFDQTALKANNTVQSPSSLKSGITTSHQINHKHLIIILVFIILGYDRDNNFDQLQDLPKMQATSAKLDLDERTMLNRKIRPLDLKYSFADLKGAGPHERAQKETGLKSGSERAQDRAETRQQCKRGTDSSKKGVCTAI